MPQIHILTDSSAYFPVPSFAGSDLVSAFPLSVCVNGRRIPDQQNSASYKQILANLNPTDISLAPPSVEEFCQIFRKLGEDHADILAILHSGSLSAAFKHANTAASIVKNSGAIIVIDSNSFGAGLGFLVQAAAKAASMNFDAHRISRLVRGLIPHVYTALFLPDLRYLSASGFLDPAQAIVGEMLGIVPFYILDSGRLVAVQKARNARQLLDLIFEFVSEFSDVSQIALMDGYPRHEFEIKNLKERIAMTFTSAQLFEHTISLSMATLLGPSILGVTILENSEELP